jgi:hypothetical protein
MEILWIALKFLATPLLKAGKWVIDTFAGDWIKEKIAARKKKDPKDILEHRFKMKKVIGEGFYRWHKAGNTRDEIVVRDVARMDTYPEIDISEKGISPWFKVGYKGLYDRGIEVFLSSPIKAYMKNGKWEVTYDDVEGSKLVYQVGRILFDNIVNIDWDGDGNYGFPHFYCSFSNKREPYEKVVYCEICKTHDGGYYYPHLFNEDHSMAGR